MSNLSNLRGDSFDEAIGSGSPVLVDFYADWCAPCRALAPVLESVAESRADTQFFKVDVDSEPELAARFAIRSIPTLLLFRPGHAPQHIQARSAAGLGQALDRAQVAEATSAAEA